MNQYSVFMKGTLRNNDGSFLFEKMEPGLYCIMVQNMGFNTLVSDAIMLSQNETFSLDTTALETKIMELEEVVIKGEKTISTINALLFETYRKQSNVLYISLEEKQKAILQFSQTVPKKKLI